MKKILILTLILFVGFSSMSFRGCLPDGFWQVVYIVTQTSGYHRPDNYGTGDWYSIYVGDNGVIWRSSGETNIIFEPKTSGTTQRLNDVRVNPSEFEQTVLAVGNNGAIVYSTNTGNDWSITPSGTSVNLYGIDFRNGIEYLAVGDNGVITASYDMVTWNTIPSGTTRNLKAISLSSSFSYGIAVGEKGTILRATNNGLNWTNISLPDTTVTLYDISQKGLYFEGNIFCIVGSGGRIYKSTDYGATWVQKPSGTTNTLRSIYFHTVDSAVVVGDNGTIRFSTNGGETWFTDAFFNSPSTRQYKSVSLVNLDNKTYSALSDTIWFVSDEPITLGLEPINFAIPDGYSLSQNYPNPFNPQSKIKFQISKFSDTRLVVYDMLGKEIETLVNQNLNAGTYVVDFDGSRHSSGVYFYKLVTDGFTDTKKMLLIK